MSKKAHALVISATLSAVALLAGCATQKPEGQTPAPGVDAKVQQTLANAAARSSEAMLTLAKTRSATHGITYSDDFKVPDELRTPITINWSGPLDELVHKVADLTGYQYEAAVGSRPNTTVLVHIAVTDLEAHKVLANAGQQAGSAADIVVNPDSKKLYVKYPPNTRNGGYASLVDAVPQSK